MMCVAVVAVLSVLGTAVPQDPAPQEDLAKRLQELMQRVENLEKENARLKKEVGNLERFSQDAAEMISRLKQIIQNGGSRPSAPADAPPDRGDAPKPGTTSGPPVPVHGKVLSISPEYGFVIANLGEDDGVKEGWMFEIVRTNRDDGGGIRTEVLAKATFEKYVETARATQSKLKIVEGSAEKIKYGDAVVANRRLDPLPPPKAGDEKPADAKAGPRKFRIFGITGGDTYHIDAGTRDGLKQSDKVYVYRDRRAIAQLRLERVDTQVSAGKIIDGTKTAEIAQNDEVLLKDPKSSLVGKVRRIDDKRGIFIDIGQLQGAKVGMTFEVRRQGKALGRIAVKELGPHHAVCDTVAPLTAAELQPEDFAESVE